MTLRWQVNAVSDIVAGPKMAYELLDLGGKVAREAANNAPVDSGRGAASIHAELFRSRGYQEVRVSWTRDRFYMQFFEFGTEKIPPQAFLRNAARRYQ